MRRVTTVTMFLFGVLLLSTLPTVHAAEKADSRIGKKIAPFKLKNQFGKEFALQSAKQEVVVVAFLGTECPLAKLYAPRLAKLQSEFPKNKVAFVAIDSNQQDSLQEIAAYAQRHGLKFPVLRDVRNLVADHFGAIRTPEVFVLDKNREVRYWGRIDDQYGYASGVGFQRPQPTREDLSEAIKEILAGKTVSVPTTEALGCHIGRVKKANPDSEVTYSNQIARIFQERCVECHREGRIGPFVMTSYDDIAGWGEMIREVVQENRMPPWHASPDHFEFLNDSRLSDEEKELITTWVDNGCPEGDPAQLPEPRVFSEGWAIGEPDQIVKMADKPVTVPAEGVIDYYHFVVDPGWTEDKWISGAEAKPQSLETVHHILVFIVPPDRLPKNLDNGGNGNGEGALTSGNLVAAYAPGANPLFTADGKTAVRVKAGSKLVFQLHYTPNGTEQKDLSYVGFKFTDESKVEFEARSTAVVNAFFSIPPGAKDHTATAETTFKAATTLTNMTPHLHTRGKAFRYELVFPDGTTKVALDVPTYDFNWQTTYHLKEPIQVPAGTRLVCTATWDNSADNLSNPDPTITVRWGEQTFEEMMIGFYVEQYPKGLAPNKPSGGSPIDMDPKQIFAQLDANKDGRLTPDEVPPEVGDKFQLIDTNRDGAITLQELEFVLQLIGKRNQN